MKSITYFRWWGFSINEGQFPNIHISWRVGGYWHLFIYVAINDKYRWCTK